ncbi:glucose-6-P dehydrogenase [Crassisporium funariophilum]|nr:glucose-6-P dehydrogenase [Crassisporium funariophilum]
MTPSAIHPTILRETALPHLTNNTIIVIAGASGDLAKKFLYPALFTLFIKNLLPQNIAIVGYARSQIDHELFLEQVTANIKDPGNDPNFDQQLRSYKDLLTYFAGSYDDGAVFDSFNEYLENIECNYDTPERNRVFYLALPSTVFAVVAEKFKTHVYSNAGINRLVVEKPIGSDLASAVELVQAISAYWTEDETFRIDHYLGQEIVRNLLVFRFGNIITDCLLNKNLVSNVQITLNETFGTEGRGGYFDSTGIIRDVIQNHLCQVLTVLTMERPVTLDAADIIDKKVELLRSIPPIENDDVLLGQYIGYLDDPDVPKDSKSSTYAANTLWINNPRWEGVPFILKGGKALHEDNVEIRVQFKDATKGLFQPNIPRSELVMRLELGMGIFLHMNSKPPGFESGVIPTQLKLDYETAFKCTFIPDAYEVLLNDVLLGDHSTFVRDDELIAAWKIFTPILHWIDGEGGGVKPSPTQYARGSRGPEGLDEYLAQRGFRA